MHVHPEVFGCFNERTSDAAAGTFNGLHDTGDAVAAEVLNERFVLNTVLDGEIKSRTSTVNNVLQKIDVAQNCIIYTSIRKPSVKSVRGTTLISVMTMKTLIPTGK